MALFSVSLPVSSDSAAVASSAFADALPNLSISLWVKTTDTSTSVSLINKESNTTGHGGFELRYNNGIVGFNFFKPSNAGFYQGHGSTSIKDGNWHSIVFTYDGAVGVQIYVDGVAETITITGGSLLGSNYSSAQDFGMGNSSADGRAIAGKCTNLRVWNTTLSSGNAATIAAGGTVSSGLIGKWDFTEGSGTTATDTITSRVLTFSAVTWSSDIPSQLMSNTFTETITDTVTLSESQVVDRNTIHLTPSDTSTMTEARTSTIKKAVVDVLSMADTCGIQHNLGELDTLTIGEWVTVERKSGDHWAN